MHFGAGFINIWLSIKFADVKSNFPPLAMRKSISEQSSQSNRFKQEVMMPLERAESPQRRRVVGRSSISAIPPPPPDIIFSPRSESDNKGAVTKRSESLCDVLCNSYKFVVNYGVFEPNFEWLPCEVHNKSRDTLLIPSDSSSIKLGKSICNRLSSVSREANRKTFPRKINKLRH